MCKPSNISTWTRKAFHISSRNRIDGAHHYNWDGFGRFFGGLDHYVIDCQNDINFLLHKLIHKCRHPIQSALRVTAFD